MLSKALRRVALPLFLIIAPSALPAQTRPTDSPPVCLGFAFGAWTPALDWRGAGHPPLDAKFHLRTPCRAQSHGTRVASVMRCAESAHALIASAPLALFHPGTICIFAAF